jgi:agmatine deiminase
MKVLYLFVLVFMTACEVRNDDKFYMPAEWEAHDAIWLGWEDDQLQYRPAVIRIIKALKQHVKIKVAVSGDSLMRVAKKYLQEEGIDSLELQFYTHER